MNDLKNDIINIINEIKPINQELINSKYVEYYETQQHSQHKEEQQIKPIKEDPYKQYKNGSINPFYIPNKKGNVYYNTEEEDFYSPNTKIEKYSVYRTSAPSIYSETEYIETGIKIVDTEKYIDYIYKNIFKVIIKNNFKFEFVNIDKTKKFILYYDDKGLFNIYVYNVIIKKNKHKREYLKLKRILNFKVKDSYNFLIFLKSLNLNDILQIYRIIKTIYGGNK